MHLALKGQAPTPRVAHFPQPGCTRPELGEEAEQVSISCMFHMAYFLNQARIPYTEPSIRASEVALGTEPSVRASEAALGTEPSVRAFGPSLGAASIRGHPPPRSSEARTEVKSRIEARSRPRSVVVQRAPLPALAGRPSRRAARPAAHVPRFR